MQYYTCNMLYFYKDKHRHSNEQQLKQPLAYVMSFGLSL